MESTLLRKRHRPNEGKYIICGHRPKFCQVVKVIEGLDAMNDLKAQTVADLLILINDFNTDERVKLLTLLAGTRYVNADSRTDSDDQVKRRLRWKLLETVGIVWHPKEADSTETTKHPHPNEGKYTIAAEGRPTCRKVVTVIKGLDAMNGLVAQTVTDLLSLTKYFTKDELIRILTQLIGTHYVLKESRTASDDEIKQRLKLQLLETVGIV